MLVKSKNYRKKTVWISLLVSLALHLAGVYLVRDLWMEEMAVEAFRARLVRIPLLFKPRRLAVGKRVEMPKVEMQYLQSQADPQEVREGELALEASVVPRVEAPLAPMVLKEIASGAKEDLPQLAQERMLSPSELGLADSMGIASMDLLRVVDMARANKDHALVMVDKNSRRDLLGYINFTHLRLYGAGSQKGGALDALVRYLRDYTKLLARVPDKFYDHFLSEELLKDPIHFFFEDGGFPPYRAEVLTYFSPEEKTLLERYLRRGGFLYIEGGNRFLREMARHLQNILGADGRLVVIPTTHAIYHAFYNFGGGFPGEDKSRLREEDVDQGWYYPVNTLEPQQIAAEQASFLNPQFANAEEEERPQPLGLWGIELNGELVGVFSDLNLHDNWQASFNTDESGNSDEPVLYSLMAATNIVAYALTHPGGLTTKEEKPVWMQKRPDAPRSAGVADATQEEDGELFAALDASLAVVQAPLGTRIEKGDLQVRLDGRYSLELIKRGMHGLLLHNLPPGRHWVELRYGGKSKQLEIDLQGGKVLTITFGLNRFAFLSQLHMNGQEIQVGVDQWLESFSDLQVEEVHLGEDRALLESADPF